MKVLLKFIAFSIAFIIVLSRKTFYLFKNWGYKDKTVNEIFREFEKPGSSEWYAMSRSSLLSLSLMTQMIQNQWECQKKVNELAKGISERMKGVKG